MEYVKYVKYVKLVLTALTFSVLITSCGNLNISLAVPNSDATVATETEYTEWTTVGEKTGTGDMDLAHFTILATVYAVNSGPANQRIIEKGGAYNGGGFDIETGSSPSDINCFLFDASGTVYTGVSTVIPTGSTQKVACSFDGTTIRLYVNGILKASLGGLNWAATSGNVFIGKAASGTSGDRDFRGTISKVDCYDRALSDTEVADE